MKTCKCGGNIEIRNDGPNSVLDTRVCWVHTESGFNLWPIETTGISQVQIEDIYMAFAAIGKTVVAVSLNESVYKDYTERVKDKVRVTLTSINEEEQQEM